MTEAATPISSRVEPTAQLEVVTPAIARKWLESNHENRSVRPIKVATYATEIRRGEWMVTGEGPKFDWTGRLFDGQHRLMAVVKADRPVRMFVFRGLDPQAQTVVDTGARRSAKDALKFAGVDAHTTELAALAKVMIAWEEGSLQRSGQTHATSREVTNPEIIEWVAENQVEALRAVRAAASIYKSPFPILSKAGFAAAYMIFARIDADDAARFVDDMVNLRLNGKGDPLYTLHARLTSAKGSVTEAVRLPGQLFLYVRTWNAWRKGESLHQLKVGKTGGGRGDKATTHISIPKPV